MASTSTGRDSTSQMRDVRNLLETAGLRDQLFGTREYTHGARYQIPRKIPLRIEPKTYFGALLSRSLQYVSVCVFSR